MKRRVGSCPACAAPIEFKLSTALVTVCDFCQSVVARADKKLEDHGKVADLVETNSPIQRGMKGKFDKKRFEVVGRVQYQHPAGGVWNEWYLQMPGDQVGWLAEAQGKFYLMAERAQNAATAVPDFDALSAGHRVDLPDGKTLVVAEKGVATALSADGSIPWAFQPGAKHHFVDLHGAGATFGTIEYREQASRLFLGQEVSLPELELEGESWESQAEFAAPNTKSLQINCPHCAGALTLHAPDQTLRVCCPSCHSLLDCQHGKLQYLETLHTPVEKPLIPLGSVGKLFDTDYTVIGFMVRFAMYEGKVYPWSEYLLYEPAKGFRWLVCNNRHWSFVESIPLTSAMKRRDNQIVYEDKTFKLYDRGIAYVKYVAGEFYWRVTAGEEVVTADFIAPPQMISSERTTAENGDELNYSLGTYLTTDELEQAFKIKELPTPWGVGTIQPRPSYVDIWLIWLGFGALLVMLDFLFSAMSYSFDQFHFFAALAAVSLLPGLLLVLNYNFEVSRWKDSDYSPYASSD